MSIVTWAESGQGVSAHSLSFNNQTIAGYAQLQATNVGNYYSWQSAAISVTKYTKLIVSNTVTRGGYNPEGFTGYIDIYVNGALLTSISGDHTEYAIDLPSNLAGISIKIRTTMAGSGSTWPWCQNLISKLTLTK